MKKFKFKVSKIFNGEKVSEVVVISDSGRFTALRRLRELYPDSKYSSSFIEEVE